MPDFLPRYIGEAAAVDQLQANICRAHDDLSDDEKRLSVAIALRAYAVFAVEYCGRDEAGALLRGVAADAGATLHAGGARERRSSEGVWPWRIACATLAILALAGWSR